MSRELCHQQEALWELLTTELVYVRKLKIMTNVSFLRLRPRPPPQPSSQLLCMVPHSLGPGRESHGGWGEGRTGNQEIPPLETCQGSWEAG